MFPSDRARPDFLHSQKLYHYSPEFSVWSKAGLVICRQGKHYCIRRPEDLETPTYSRIVGGLGCEVCGLDLVDPFVLVGVATHGGRPSVGCSHGSSR